MLKKISIKVLKNFHLVTIIFLFILVILTPFIVRGGAYIFSEEIIESGLLVLIFASYFLLDAFYKSELHKKEEELTETFKYIGQMNVKLEAIDFLGNSDISIPKSKNELKDIFGKFSEIALGIAGTPYVYYRIVENVSGNTLFEFSMGRNGDPVPTLECGNKDLINGASISRYSVVSSKYKNSDNAVYCVLPAIAIGSAEMTLLQAMQNYLAAIYIIYGSQQPKAAVV